MAPATRRDTDGDHRGALPQHEPQHVARVRAKCETDTDLLGALRDGVCEDAVDANRGQHRRDATEDAEQDGVEPRTGDRGREDVAHRCHALDRRCAVDLRGDAAEIGSADLRPSRGTNGEGDCAPDSPVTALSAADVPG
jgi:hypothetical protein